MRTLLFVFENATIQCSLIKFLIIYILKQEGVLL